MATFSVYGEGIYLPRTPGAHFRYSMSAPLLLTAHQCHTPECCLYAAASVRAQDDFEKHQVDGVGLLSLTEADLHHKLHLKKVRVVTRKRPSSLMALETRLANIARNVVSKRLADSRVNCCCVVSVLDSDVSFKSRMYHTVFVMVSPSFERLWLRLWLWLWRA